jgi:hypothetical protein
MNQLISTIVFLHRFFSGGGATNFAFSWNQRPITRRTQRRHRRPPKITNHVNFPKSLFFFKI